MPNALAPSVPATASLGIGAALLCGSTSASCALAVNSLLASGRSVLAAVQSGLTQAEGLRHLAAAASELAKTAGADAGASICFRRMRCEVMRMMRRHTAPNAHRANEAADTAVLPLLVTDPSMLLVTVTLLWPRERWEMEADDWQRLLLFCYTLAAAQLVVFEDLPDALVDQTSVSDGGSCEWVVATRALRREHLAAGPESSQQTASASAASVAWERLLPFLRHALLFSHCCLFSTPAERVVAAAAAPSEEMALLAALGLPHPTQLDSAFGVSHWLFL